MFNSNTLTFKDKVYKATQKIPKGKVATYGQIARLVGSPKAGRAVGTCLMQNSDSSVTPCHRVVAKSGSLSGYSMGMGLATKKELLIAEGVSFKGDRVDLSCSLWVE